MSWIRSSYTFEHRAKVFMIGQIALLQNSASIFFTVTPDAIERKLMSLLLKFRPELLGATIHHFEFVPHQQAWSILVSHSTVPQCEIGTMAEEEWLEPKRGPLEAPMKTNQLEGISMTAEQYRESAIRGLKTAAEKCKFQPFDHTAHKVPGDRFEDEIPQITPEMEAEFKSRPGRFHGKLTVEESITKAEQTSSRLIAEIESTLDALMTAPEVPGGKTMAQVATEFMAKIQDDFDKPLWQDDQPTIIEPKS
jgi:hypothetical protein